MRQITCLGPVVHYYLLWPLIGLAMAMMNEISNTIVISQIILRVEGSRCLNYDHVGYCSNRYICMPRCLMLHTGGEE